MKIDLEKVRGVVEPIMGHLGYELVDLQFFNDRGHWILRVMIDRDGGVRVSDCEQVSHEIGTPLDVEGLILQPYNLEVSSPGLDRPLTRETDYGRFKGQVAAIHTDEPVEGRRNFKGVLQGIEEGVVTIHVDNRDYQIPYRTIGKAHLVY